MWLEKGDFRFPICTPKIILELTTRTAVLLTALGIEMLFNPHLYHISEMDLINHYKRPRRQSLIPIWATIFIIVILPLLIVTPPLLLTKNYVDFTKTLSAWTLSLSITALITGTVKVITGRPRPDFYYRCFPDGKITKDLICTGNIKEVAEGRKSFPSGHSSFAFCSMGFICIWLCGKLKIFSHRRGCALRMLACLAPLLIATVVAMSRFCDNHHHWEDIVVGSIFGFISSYLCYTQYYHPLESDLCGRSYVNIEDYRIVNTSQTLCCTRNL